MQVPVQIPRLCLTKNLYKWAALYTFRSSLVLRSTVADPGGRQSRPHRFHVFRPPPPPPHSTWPLSPLQVHSHDTTTSATTSSFPWPEKWVLTSVTSTFTQTSMGKSFSTLSLTHYVIGPLERRNKFRSRTSCKLNMCLKANVTFVLWYQFNQAYWLSLSRWELSPFVHMD